LSVLFYGSIGGKVLVVGYIKKQLTFAEQRAIKEDLGYTGFKI
jgi:hypothetical protein